MNQARSEERRKELYTRQVVLEERINELGLSKKSKLSKDIKVNFCKVEK